MDDPYPGVVFDKWWAALKERYPNGEIDRHPPSGDVFISLPKNDGTTFRAGLKWPQAKFLAYNDVSGEDLEQQRLPKGWPE